MTSWNITPDEQLRIQVARLQRELADQLQVTENVYGLLVKAKRERNEAQAAAEHAQQALQLTDAETKLILDLRARAALTGDGTDA